LIFSALWILLNDLVYSRNVRSIKGLIVNCWTRRFVWNPAMMMPIHHFCHSQYGVPIDKLLQYHGYNNQLLPEEWSPPRWLSGCFSFKQLQGLKLYPPWMQQAPLHVTISTGAAVVDVSASDNENDEKNCTYRWKKGWVVYRIKHEGENKCFSVSSILCISKLWERTWQMVILTCGWRCCIVSCVPAAWLAYCRCWLHDEGAWAVQPRPHPLALCGILALLGVGDTMAAISVMWSVASLKWQYILGSWTFCTVEGLLATVGSIAEANMSGAIFHNKSLSYFAPVTARTANIYSLNSPSSMVVLWLPIVYAYCCTKSTAWSVSYHLSWHHCCRHCHGNMH